MSKSVRVSDSFHEYIESHNREGETMEDTLRRLVGGPHPESVTGIISSETATRMHDAIETKREQDVETKRALRERFE